jgi:hypothetical protein
MRALPLVQSLTHSFPARGMVRLSTANDSASLEPILSAALGHLPVQANDYRADFDDLQRQPCESGAIVQPSGLHYGHFNPF